jgi:hypothetical protein
MTISIKDIKLDGCLKVGISNDIGNKYNIGEFYDLLCVASNKKPLAAFDFTAYGIRKHRKGNKKLINEIIDFCNKKGVQMLYCKTPIQHYLTAVFFLPKNKSKAIKLMGIFRYNKYTQQKISLFNIFKRHSYVIEYDYMVGKLLGYSNKDIVKFYKRNYYYDLTNDDSKYLNNKLKTMKITFEDLQDNYEIIHYTTIKNI